MNDRFKFRVWDNINKRYEKDLTLIDKDGDLCYQDGEKYCNGEYPEDFTIEQCTGLRDKNGKLIYEGDVLLKDGYKYHCVWWRDFGRWAFFSETKNDVDDALVFSENFEIIGNVHDQGKE